LPQSLIFIAARSTVINPPETRTALLFYAGGEESDLALPSFFAKKAAIRETKFNADVISPSSIGKTEFAVIPFGRDYLGLAKDLPR